MTECDFEPLDLAACYGSDLMSRSISLVTSSPLAPRRLKWGPSHVALLCRYHGRMIWFESTTMCPHPCVILREQIAGCQAHLPEMRIHDYVSDGGRVDLYRLSPIDRLSETESELLTHILVTHLVGKRVTYDPKGAFFSGTRLFKRTSLLPASDLNSLFCSELAAKLCQRFGRLNRANPTKFNPSTLLRELVRQGTFQFHTRFNAETFSCDY